MHLQVRPSQKITDWQGRDPIGEAGTTVVAAERVTPCEVIGWCRREVQPIRMVRMLLLAGRYAGWGPGRLQLWNAPFLLVMTCACFFLHSTSTSVLGTTSTMNLFGSWSPERHLFAGHASHLQTRKCEQVSKWNVRTVNLANEDVIYADLQVDILPERSPSPTAFLRLPYRF